MTKALVVTVAYAATLVGKPRKPYTGGDVAAAIVIHALLSGAVISL